MNIQKNVLDFWNNQKSIIVFVILLFVFISTSMFFALRLKEGIIPDEPHHFFVPSFFSSTWGIPEDDINTIRYGMLNHWPFLSYWINARIINLLNWVAPGLNDRTVLIIFRLLNIVFSTITVIYCYLFAREVIKNRWGELFTVFLLINTLMFTFLSGGNSYDNLMNLCSFAGIYYLICVFNGKPFYKNSMMWLISIMIGSLVKVTMLPLAIIMVVLWFSYIIKVRETIDFQLKLNLTIFWKLLIIVTLFAINFSIYGVNIIRYRKLLPTCIQFFTVEQCMAYPQFVRDESLKLEKKLSLSDVVNEGYPDPIEYGFDYWTSSMLKRIYGIMGHQVYFPDIIITFHRLLILWMILIIVRYWEKPSYSILCACIIFLFYLFVLFIDNYTTEMFFGFKNVGIQGRYIFPVIGIYYTVMIYSFLKIRSPILRWMTFLAVILLFLYSSPIVFLLRFYNSKFSDWFI